MQKPPNIKSEPWFSRGVHPKVQPSPTGEIPGGAGFLSGTQRPIKSYTFRTSNGHSQLRVHLLFQMPNQSKPKDQSDLPVTDQQPDGNALEMSQYCLQQARLALNSANWLSRGETGIPTWEMLMEAVKFASRRYNRDTMPSVSTQTEVTSPRDNKSPTRAEIVAHPAIQEAIARGLVTVEEPEAPKKNRRRRPGREQREREARLVQRPAPRPMLNDDDDEMSQVD